MFPIPAATTIVQSHRRETNSLQPSASSRSMFGATTLAARGGSRMPAKMRALTR
jgi:hypothetical protein